jgi:hypothetical protein
MLMCYKLELLFWKHSRPSSIFVSNVVAYLSAPYLIHNYTRLEMFVRVTHLLLNVTLVSVPQYLENTTPLNILIAYFKVGIESMTVVAMRFDWIIGVLTKQSNLVDYEP